MSDISRNATAAQENTDCPYERLTDVLVLVIDLVTVLVGQPAVVKVLWLNVTSKRPTDVLNLNLAVFLDTQYLMATLDFVFVFALPEGHKALLKVMVVYVQIGGPMSLFFISLERYVAVLHPTSYPLLRTYRLREAGAAAIWLCAAIIVPTISFTNDHTPQQVKGILKSIPLGIMILTTYTMAFCSFRISRELKKTGPGQERVNPAKRRAFVTVCATTTITLFFYVPVAVMQNTSIISGKNAECFITGVIIFFLSAASIVHPLFYLHTHGQLLTCRKN